MNFADREAAAYAMASYTALLSIEGHGLHMQLGRLCGMAADASARDRLKRFRAAVGLRYQSW
jgi:hypothetical protein